MYPEEGWQHEKVKRVEEVLNFNCYRMSLLPDFETDVELSKVVGTDHDSYNKGSWLEMQYNVLHHAKYTVDEYLDMVRNPDHYADKNEPIVLRQYGEEYILCQSGNHRTCHAKFAGLSHIRAQVQQYVIDPALITEET